jgi:hypothetical protein
MACALASMVARRAVMAGPGLRPAPSLAAGEPYGFAGQVEEDSLGGHIGEDVRAVGAVSGCLG